MASYRGALIGCGFFAINQLHAWRDAEGVDIVALCDRDPERLSHAGELFGIDRRYSDAEQMLAPLHFPPHVCGTYAGGRPQHGEVVEKIGALSDHRIRVAADRIDGHLDGFLGQFLNYLRRAALEQPGRPRGGRIEVPGANHRQIEPLNRIIHDPAK